MPFQTRYAKSMQQKKPKSLGNIIAWDDTVLPFQLDRSNIRGRVARLDGVLDAVLSRHQYPSEVEALVAEAVLLTALIGQMIDLRWKLSLQIRGQDAMRLIATDYYGPNNQGEPARIRAYASHDADHFDNQKPAFSQFGNGYFALLLDQGAGNDPYQGITGLTGSSLSDSAEAYFAQSEQIPTRFSLSFGRTARPGEKSKWRGGGIMMQHLPEASGGVKAGKQGDDDAENWNRANILLDSVESHELVGPTVQPTELLFRLFHQEQIRVFDAQSIQFGCSCSAQRVRESLSIYSAKDIAHMTTPEGIVTADCQFCGSHYEFDPDTLGFEAKGAPFGKG